MTPAAQPETIGESQKYWTHKVGSYPGPVSVTRMAQLVDFDDRLYETARIVYRFLISWYHDEHGDALMSMNHVSKTMKQRTPAGAIVPSRSAVHRAIIALMETGWVVRTFKGRGKGKGASRYVPVMNVLELAAQGKFPQPSHATGTVEPSRLNGTVVSHATGTVGTQPSHATGIKTLSHDPRTDADTCKEDIDFAPPAPALAGSAAAKEGYDELFDAYGVRKEYAAGRVEYEKLTPSPDLHAEIVQAAKAWRAAAGDIERMHIARWIREQRFRENPKERKSKPAKAEPEAVTLPEPTNDNAADWMPYRRETLEIVRAYRDVDNEYDEGVAVEYLNLDYLRLEDGEDCGGDSFIIESSKKELQDQGQEKLRAFLDAAGLHSPNNAEELVGKTFVRIMPTKFAPAYLYEPVPKEAPKHPTMPPGYIRPWERPRVVKKVDRNAIDWSKYRSAVDDDEENAA